MTETTRLGLPLVQAAQAQKHVTVNSGLERLDALVKLVLTSLDETVPPEQPDGMYAVPPGALGAWEGKGGMVAFAANGGWDFASPQQGWSAWIADLGAAAIHDGSEWIPGAVTLSWSGAGISLRTVETDHVVTPGPASSTSAVIPAQSVVYGVTGRVLSQIGGDATAFDLGIAGEAPDRYGTGYSLNAGSWLRGLTSSPLAYYAPTALTLTAVGGSFTGGSVRLAVHLAELRVPGS
ncbi:DUF2793 domain-containing protein [Palleronia sp. KMU-117]|uniref:DUF2793 domain-containing protein n=1 Tax=Palleronia sp. KMU-117 TaxID=3434108 RepID=UPI003D75334E